MSEKYSPVFIPIIREKQTKIDLNYYGIRQKMKKHGINTFKSIKQTNEETNINFRKYYEGLKKYYEEMNQFIQNYYDGGGKIW